MLNTYTRFDGHDVKAADAYWAAVRATWDRVAREKNGIAIQEQADTGTVISARLLKMVGEIQSGKFTTAKAIAEAKKLIKTNTRKL